MRVVTFPVDRANRLMIEDKGYFVFKRQNETLCVPTECPHRGGPMHLAKVSDCGEHLVCPWHDNSFSCQSIRRKALPLVQRKGTIKVVAKAQNTIAFWNEDGIVSSL
ncbi:Rieske (2Fe-2S) protein [Reinekea blandensis]|uniref:Rieske domain-containing protein n=1 Tax=Reinekea blandensis MED297 TaxID=314283 RepID=A4BF16_9GAMM|nr:Rieske 2Fe-2S domain-containing protein [Reinekea blandensis]EAR09351.1 hypothetical protein MED297_18723 [Reinekea sp. MED297] [Reinekea blandensis MED297]